MQQIDNVDIFVSVIILNKYDQEEEIVRHQSKKIRTKFF